MKEEVEMKTYVNGEFVNEKDAKISVFDHGLLYGDGIFEGIRAYNSRIFKLDEHVGRLFESANAINLKMPLESDALKRAIIETCRINNIENGYTRPIVTRGIGDLGLDPRRCNNPSLIIIAKHFMSLYGDAYERGLKVVTCSWRRMPSQCLSPNIKSLNYLNNILARIEANNADADEALFLDMEGYVSEASADNLFIIKNGVVITPSTITNLKGITRDTVIDICKEKGFEVREEFFTLFDVYNADEVFITGTAAEVGPVVEVDGRFISDGKPGSITKDLMKTYSKIVNTTGTPIYDD
jgi:branched-chain amino acid aminotransferase